ncbi:MAG: DUF2339 domain-containing protein [Leptospiraceae bacterium]|nr:DUF2339 domain-containing protein [Leptospiraceae bacterium]
MLKKNWIGLIGVLFIFLAFLTILKIGFEEGWIPEEAKIALGFVLGVSGLFFGFTLYQKKKETIGEIIAGLGAGFLYATFAYSSFSSKIQWSVNTLLISMITLSSIILFTGFKFDLRVLSNISLIGGLLTPIIIHAEPSQIFLLFCFVLILNIVAMYLSSTKIWLEMKFISFFATLVVYTTYYKFFKPESWGEPFFYLSSFFFVYMAGVIFTTFKKERLDIANLYLGILNGLSFTFWSIFIFKSIHVSYSIPLITTGFVFLGTSVFFYFKNTSSKLPALLYFIIGLALIAISGNDLGKLFTTKGMNFVINAFIWTFIVSVFYLVSYYLKEELGIILSMAVYAIISIYWYLNAWNVEWVEWFGLRYIPFLNLGGLVWIAIATLGFSISLSLDRLNRNTQSQKIRIAKMPPNDFSLIFAIVSHIIVGGLLTIQIENTWFAYELKFLEKGSAISFSWILYSLVIFLWGSYTKNTVFRIFGSIVLVGTSLKVIFSDLSGESTLYKAIFLLSLGFIILLIAFVNQKWSETEEDKKS